MKICGIDNCGKKHFAKGFCNKHYVRNRKYGDPRMSKVIRDHPETCTIEGCDKKYRCVGLCQHHYERMLKFGDVNITKKSWNKDKKCDVSGCNNPNHSHGVCISHIRQKNKEIVMNHYTNGTMRCQCRRTDCWHNEQCIVIGLRFLTINHDNNDGNIDRKNNKTSLYHRLIKNGFRDDLSAMCWTCNSSQLINS